MGGDVISDDLPRRLLSSWHALPGSVCEHLARPANAGTCADDTRFESLPVHLPEHQRPQDDEYYRRLNELLRQQCRLERRQAARVPQVRAGGRTRTVSRQEPHLRAGADGAGLGGGMRRVRWRRPDDLGDAQRDSRAAQPRAARDWVRHVRRLRRDRPEGCGELRRTRTRLPAAWPRIWRRTSRRARQSSTCTVRSAISGRSSSSRATR